MGQMEDKFIIPLNGLASGESRFFWHAGKEFFDSYDNSEILAADIDIEVVVEKSGRYLGIDCDIEGSVSVECDRCLDELEMSVDVEIRLSVKYGEEESSDEHHEGEREVVFIPETDAEFDMSQIVYDYVCLALPMQRVHEDGGCNPEAMSRLSTGPVQEAGDENSENNPFSALKDMFK